MSAPCITCQKFTLKPRQADGFNDWLRELDRQYLQLGCGRCQLTTVSYIWHPAEYVRTCSTYVPIAADQVQKRRALMDERRQ